MEKAEQYHYWDRVNWAKRNLEPVQPQYAIIWEDPDTPDGPMKITVPSPEWMAMALHGGLLPPIEAYLHDKTTPDGAPKLHPYAEPIGSMSEEEAMEYMLQKDVPIHVWAEKRNSTAYKIVPKCMIPEDGPMRGAWRIKQGDENV